MAFTLGRRSREQLQTVRPDLADVVWLALWYTDVDFSVIEGVRTLERQRELLATGHTWTLRSRHLANSDGFAEAVDIYPWVDGATSHDDTNYRRVAKAMFRAAQELGVKIKWGGFWYTPDKPHWEIDGESKLRHENLKLEARIAELGREVEVLRLYGNKDCTAMADEALQERKKG